MERTVREFELGGILIIFLCGLMDAEKREDGLQVTHIS